MAVLLPALGLLAYLQYDSLNGYLRALNQSGEGQANEAARNTDRALSRINSALDFLLRRDELRQLDSARCDTLLAGFYSTDLLLRNMVVLDQNGQTVCAANRHRLLPTSAIGLDWYNDALRANGRYVSSPYRRHTDGEPGLLFTDIIRDINGSRKGMVVAAIDVERFASNILKPYDLPAGSIMSVITEDGTLLARSHESSRVFGTKVRSTPHDVLRLPEPVPVFLGVDNVLRVRTLVKLQNAPWTLFVGIPVKALQDAKNQAIWTAAGALVLSIAACLLVAFHHARRLSAPARTLSDAAKRVGQGERSVRADPALPGEFGLIAQEFNAMVEALDRLEQERLETANLRAKSQAKTEFLARMSHELRTPLNALLGFSALLRESTAGTLDETQTQQLALICQAGQQLRALIDDVLDLARIEAGQLPVNIQEADPSWLLQSAARMCEGQASAAGVKLIVDPVERPVPAVRTDPLRLQQSLLNLLSNAIKYNRPGGEVRLSLRVLDGHVELAVSDNGLGMTQKQVDRAFEPFNRLGRETSGIPGAGIGLPLTRHLMDLLGGRVELQSIEGKGTTARLVLPRFDNSKGEEPAATPAPPPVPASSAPAPGPTPESATPRSEAASPKPTGVATLPGPAPDPEAPPEGVILYIEDIPMNVALIKALLKQTPGVKLVVAEDGTTGLAMAAEVQPDLVFLDMNLPDMSGLDVLASLLGNESTRDIPVIAISAGAMPDEVARTKAAGASDYWTKPIQLDQFRAGVRAWLPVRRSAKSPSKA